MMTLIEEPDWIRLSKREVHRGYVILSEHEVRLPNGGVTQYEVDESYPCGVAVLGLSESGLVRLAREYRYPVGRWIYDLPGGAAGFGEDPFDAARREYEEETGLKPIELIHLHTFFQNPARASYPVHLYLCRSCTVGDAVTDDPQEVVRTVEMPVGELDERIRSGEIIDPAVLISRLIAAQRGYLPEVGRSSR